VRRCWSSVTSPSAASRRPRTTQGSSPVTSSSGSCAGPTPSRAGRAISASGTCAATARYTEHGIKGLHGFARERYRAPADRLVPVSPELGLAGVLLEPASVVAKAWEHIERIAGRGAFEPRVALVTGAGPIGLLAALLGAQRGLEVHVLDLVTEGPKPALVADLGATYHSEPLQDLDLEPDVLVECTGVPQVVAAAMTHTAGDGITCLTGVSSAGRALPLDVGGLNREIVLQNDVVFGSVNSNRRHYEAAADALARADRGWLDRMLTRRVPLDDHEDALTRSEDDVKVVLEVSGGAVG
jgi:threonine dehydrogenase-like Zn-dependent dehydrogenase